MTMAYRTRGLKTRSMNQGGPRSARRAGREIEGARTDDNGSVAAGAGASDEGEGVSVKVPAVQGASGPGIGRVAVLSPFTGGGGSAPGGTKGTVEAGEVSATGSGGRTASASGTVGASGSVRISMRGGSGRPNRSSDVSLGVKMSSASPIGA